MSCYYPEYPSNFSKARICFIIPLIRLRTNAPVWGLLSSCRYLCPTRIGKCRTKESCKTAAVPGREGWERHKYRLQRLQGEVWVRCGSISLSPFPAPAIRATFLSQRTVLGSGSLHPHVALLFICVSISSWTQTQSNQSYTVQVTGEKSQSRICAARKCWWSLQSPPLVSYGNLLGQVSGKRQSSRKLCHPEESFQVCYRLRCNFPKVKREKIPEAALLFICHLHNYNF